MKGRQPREARDVCATHENCPQMLNPPMLEDVRRAAFFAAPLLVLTLAAVVYWLGSATFAFAQAGNSPPEAAAARPGHTIAVEANDLPPQVAEMREAILEAVRSGNIEDLRTAIEWNEITPIFSDGKMDDPIAFLKSLSADGEGREVLAILGNVLSMRAARLPIGRDLENNVVYVWPYLAEVPLDKLTPAQEVDLYRLIPAAAAKTMREGKTWTWYRLVIGSDGTWHTFIKH